MIKKERHFKKYKDKLLIQYNITEKEFYILNCLCIEKSSKKISRILNIKPRTVDSHIYNIMQKLGKNSRDMIVDFIEENNYIFKDLDLCKLIAHKKLVLHSQEKNNQN